MNRVSLDCESFVRVSWNSTNRNKVCSYSVSNYLYHGEKSVQIRSYLWCPYFPVFGLNREIYFANLRIQCEYRKIRTRSSSIFGKVLRSDYIIMEITRISSMLPKHCIKFARIQVFTDLYSPRYCLYTGKYRSVKTRILAYFMYWKSLFIGKN